MLLTDCRIVGLLDQHFNRSRCAITPPTLRATDVVSLIDQFIIIVEYFHVF